ncbi:MAG: hypothetical protein KAJ73_00760 [Zetaproteobacteria bacterium]|nr:hypothetical protein [Zetaproteobacteria bacterium]
MNIETIFESLVNGQRKQMVEQIDEMGADVAFQALKEYLDNHYGDEPPITAYRYFSDATISYFRIKAR